MTATAPENPNTRLPMPKRDDALLEKTIVFKLWQALSAEGPMASMVGKDAIVAATNAKKELMNRGRSSEEVNALWTNWVSSSGFEVSESHPAFKFYEPFFAFTNEV